jgi:glutamate--cysteine ligase
LVAALSSDLQYNERLHSSKNRNIMLNSECTSTLSLVDDEIVNTLLGIVRGVEKEGLRVTSESHVAQTSHQLALGSSLTNPSITTDYSEALLEFITPVLDDVEATVAYLSELHTFTSCNIEQERIWPASMPCRLEGDESIPIADYGSSNVGTLKHVYRQGLGVRYGRVMQSIAGIHYNFSLPDSFWQAYQVKLVAQQEHNESPADQSLQDFKSAHYFSLIRNFRRYSWILHYLFGASPVLDKSFLAGLSEQEHGLDALLENTYGLPYATSLRMSDLGYQNTAQEELHVSYGSLHDYVTTLAEAMTHEYPAYQDLGVKVDGQYRQLNTNVLQIENEYYSDIRPKRVTQSGEKPIAALRDRGVEYIEVRILDINPFLAEGLSSQQIRFMDAFLLYCLFSQCPQTSDTSCPEIRANQHDVILRGRDPSLTLTRGIEQVPFKLAATELLEAIMETAKLLDKSHDSFEYSSAVYAQQAKVDDSRLTPSAQMMELVDAGSEFIDIVSEQANRHKTHFASLDRNTAFQEDLLALAKQSIEQQHELEAQETISFDEYLAEYNRR